MSTKLHALLFQIVFSLNSDIIIICGLCVVLTLFIGAALKVLSIYGFITGKSEALK
jgi:hypothetical protein